jgi:hypothetical protein
MEPHQERVVSEKAELDDRLGKLCDFIDSETFAGLPTAEKKRLDTQRRLMYLLSALLGARIAAFSNANEYVLDRHDSGYWLARWRKQTHPIGRDKDEAERIIQRLNGAHRPNLEMQGDSLMVCWNTHDKGQPCEYETLVRNAV